ncbi:MAG: hypothetical protein GVY26_08575 [Bacteroidetes bacterium]|jgi:hypothetical protein|nr:hypothetical protein [Bacteroidota bacterium]
MPSKTYIHAQLEKLPAAEQIKALQLQKAAPKKQPFECIAQAILEVFNSPVGFGGDIIVSDGGVLRIKSLVEFGEYKKLIIQDGGKVEISGASAVLTDCPEAIRWDGIEVQAGGNLEVDEGHIHSALHAVHASSGSTVNLVNIEAVGGGGYENTRTGIWLDGDVNVEQLRGTKIHDYYNGIHCNNSNGSYHLDQGEMSGCFTGIGLSDDIALGSRFFVNGEIIFHMPNDANISGWFTSEPVNNPYTCASTPGPNWMPLWDDEEALCAYYSEVIDSNDHNSREYILMVQAMLRYDQYRSEYD